MPSQIEPTGELPSPASASTMGLVSIGAGWLALMCIHWRRMVVGTFASSVLALVIAFLSPKVYEASATLVVTSSAKTGDLGMLGSIDGAGLSSLIGGAGLGNRTAVKQLFALLGSGEFGLEAVRTFRLDTAWRIKPRQWENLLRAWGQDFSAKEDDNGCITLSFRSKDTALARRVAEWGAETLEERYQALQRKQTESELRYFDGQVQERLRLLRQAEDSLTEFQDRNRIYAPEEQMRFLSSLLMDKEKDLAELDEKIAVLSEESGRTSQPVQHLGLIKGRLERDLRKMVDSSSPGMTIDKSIPMNLRKAVAFQRLQRNVLLHGKVYAFLIQQQEQIELEKKKDVPVLQEIDSPRMPTKKVAPPRVAILAFGLFFGFFASLCSILFREEIAAFSEMFRHRLRIGA